MIRGTLRDERGRRRPFVVAAVGIPALGVAGDVAFLVDTGADSTLLAPRDVTRLGIDLQRLPEGPPSTGVGGRTPTAFVQATITLDRHTFDIRLSILAPRAPRQQAVLGRIPSLLGRDILAHFALFFEERTRRVLQLEPHEADALPLP